MHPKSYPEYIVWEHQHSLLLMALQQGNHMRDMVSSEKSPLVLRDAAGATALLLRQYFFALRALERAPDAVSTLESVEKLLGGMEAARRCPLARVRVLPGRLDGVFFCRGIGEKAVPGRPSLLGG